MRTPQKARKIYDSLRQDILMRRYPPGSLLPREIDFAVKLGVSRDTLRHALSMLEADCLIRRVRGYGSFVSETMHRKKITFLLPYAQSLEPYSGFITGLLQGVAEGVRECNCELETLPISPTNNPEDIDWSKLFNLNSESRVVVCGFWFEKIFPFLLASRCKVAMIHDQLHMEPTVSAPLSRWCDMVKMTQTVMKQMTEQLFLRGCRNPLFLLRYLNDKRSCMMECISEVCAEYMPERPPLFVEVQSDMSIADSRRLVSACREKYHFDGCLANESCIFKCLREVEPRIPCGFFDLMQQDEKTADDLTFYSEFSMYEIGRAAVRQLMSDDSQGRRFEFFAKIREYGKTGTLI